ncbi:hypothetical protein [Bradyrhizobium sp.]|uniref:hypothetical protein n=1 Tax=Bradyrhizobium sp. TaxID=376 RepID=UPI00260C5760|nr:hypothetical protein [Bradyrhizobium sp.]
MVQLVSTPRLTTQAPRPANRLARVLVVGGAGIVAVLFIAAVILWARYGATVFFETIASGFAACF